MLVLGLKGANPLQRDRHVISGIDLGAMRVLVAIAAVSALDAYACAARLEGRSELGLRVRTLASQVAFAQSRSFTEALE